ARGDDQPRPRRPPRALVFRDAAVISRGAWGGMRGALAPSLARPRISRVRLRENVDAYVFIAPWLIGFVCLTAGPMLASVVLSLSDWDLLNPLRLIGPGNFVEAVKDDLFWLSLYNTAYYTFVSVPLHLVAALGAALILNMRLRWINYYRTMVYLPSITPSVASAFLWMWIFNPDFGLANAAMDLFHLPLDVDLGPGLGQAVADPDRPLDDRAADGDPARRAAERAGEPLRGRGGRRRRALAQVPAHHAADALAHRVPLPGDLADPQLPGVQPCLHHDPGRPGQR